MAKDVEKFYLIRGEELIDNLFQKGYFREDVSRKELRQLDELVGWLFQSYAQSAVNIDRVTRKIKERKHNG